MTTIKTASDLKYAVEQSGNESHFFTRKTMSFFGDTMRNYGVRKVILRVNEQFSNGLILPVEKEVYELYRRKPVKHNNQQSAYFDMETFKRVFEAK